MGCGGCSERGGKVEEVEIKAVDWGKGNRWRAGGGLIPNSTRGVSYLIGSRSITIQSPYLSLGFSAREHWVERDESSGQRRDTYPFANGKRDLDRSDYFHSTLRSPQPETFRSSTFTLHYPFPDPENPAPGFFPISPSCRTSERNEKCMY